MLEGMFAFAIYDFKIDKLFLCRDKVGQKPLFFKKTEGQFVFSSEIKSIINITNDNKLDNKNFIEKAPSNVIKENTDKQKVYQQELIDLKNLLDKLSN